MNHNVNECRNQVLRFFRGLDERQYAAMASMLDRESLWHRQGKTLQGPDAVLEALQKRSATMCIAHLISNLVVDSLTDDTCVMRGYMLVVRHDPGETLSSPAPLNGIESIRDLRVTLTQSDSKWLIKELSAEAVLFAQSN